MDIKEILRAEASNVIDVRTVEEFRGGHVFGSLNIPLDEIPDRIEEIKQMRPPLIFCCASGGRSGQVAEFLTQQGLVDVYNGGGWLEVNGALK